MSRYPSRGFYSCDQNGAIIQGAAVTVKLAGTQTAAKIYLAASGGVAVYSMTSDATTGFFQFWVSDADYNYTQLFDVYINKAVFANVAYQQSVLYNEAIFSFLSSIRYIDVKVYGAKGDGTTDDTAAIAAAINAANVSGLVPYNMASLYFPAGIYCVTPNTLPAIKTDVYGPEATILGVAGSTGTYPLITVDYHNSVGQTFILKAIQGPTAVAPFYTCGLYVVGSDNSFFFINQITRLDTGIGIGGLTNVIHTAQNTFNVQAIFSVTIGINLTAGGDRIEATTFNIEYLNPRTVNGISVYLSNNTSHVMSNVFNINVLELQDSTGEVGFSLNGTTPANIVGNLFNVKSQLLTGTGDLIGCVSNIGVNTFNFPQTANIYSGLLVATAQIVVNQTHQEVCSFTTPNDSSGTWQDSGTAITGTFSKVRGIRGVVFDGTNWIMLGGGQVSTSERCTVYIAASNSHIMVANNTTVFKNQQAYIVVDYVD